MATERKGFTVVTLYSSSIKLKSIATGNIFEVYVEGKFKTNEGDLVSVLIENNDKWKVLVNEMNGDTAAITKVTQWR